MRRLLSTGIILLFIGMIISTSTGLDVVEQSNTASSNGNTLYVGGSGPGNYTKIQDAIDDASNGDTVFVYNGTYYENLTVDTSINLIGEDKNTTIIDGKKHENVIYVSADLVTIREFTIQNGKLGILLNSNNNNIIHNKIMNNWEAGLHFSYSSNNTILDNNLSSCYDGIYLWYGINNILQGNKIENIGDDGIYILGSKNVKITQNYINSCRYGIFLDYGSFEVIDNIVLSNKYGISIQDTRHCTIQGNYISYNNDTGIEGRRLRLVKIIENNIIHNKKGIAIYWSRFTSVKRNNIIDNIRQAYFFNGILTRWRDNYWNRPRLIPKPIFGYLYTEIWTGDPWNPKEIQIPWVQFDWHPAQEPYDLEV
jgi:parallel beta-helix repeat protein